MREALPELREALPGVRLALAAMGPKMTALGGSSYDAVFTNWMTPEAAATARDRVHAAAAEAGREPQPVLGYVRTALVIDVTSDRTFKFTWIAVKKNGEWRVISETMTKVMPAK